MQLPIRKLVVRKRKRSSLFPESQVQVDGLKWLRLYHHEAWKCIIKIDNEGKRTPAGHALAIAMGLHVGASDLLCAYPVPNYCGLWVEVKRPNYKLIRSNMEHHERQMAFIYRMREKGYAASMAIGLDQFMEVFKFYLKGY